MSKLQEQAEKAWKVLSNLEEYRYCAEDCENCPQSAVSESRCVDRGALQSWLHVNGFPARRPHIHTAAELAKQLIMGCGLSCLTQRIAQVVEAVTCPDCGKHTLYRERRMACTGCGGVYPADKWANNEPCGCGCMDARYFGVHPANRLGQLEFQHCLTPGCRWEGDYRRLTAQELADAAQVLADEQYEDACVCPDCSAEANGVDQRDGVFNRIDSCDICGRKNLNQKEEKNG